jgi:hypothetical protein
MSVAYEAGMTIARLKGISRLSVGSLVRPFGTLGQIDVEIDVIINLVPLAIALADVALGELAALHQARNKLSVKTGAVA